MNGSCKCSLVAVASTILFACGGGRDPGALPAGQAVIVSVSPSAVSLAAGDALRFTASVTGTSDATVTWSVRETAAGAIDVNGAYVAPLTAGTYHVVATSAAEPASSATAVVTVTPGSAVQVNVSPAAATVAPSSALQLNAAVDGGDASQPVVWSIDEGAAGGSVTNTGLYIAPATPGTYNVVASVSDLSATATSATDPTAPLAATVWHRGRSRITVAPAPVTISVSPSTASITAAVL